MSNLEVVESIVAVAASVVALVTSLVAGKSLPKRDEENAETLLQNSSIAREKKDTILRALRRRRVLFGWSVGTVILLVALLVLSWVTRDEAGRQNARSALCSIDPLAFQDTPNQEFSIARVFPTRSALDHESPLAVSVDAAVGSFDFYAIAGTALVAARESILAALRRGVRVRILLTDFGPDNAANVTAYLAAQRVDPAVHTGRGRQTRSDLLAIQNMTKADRDTYKGTLDVKWLSLPFHNSIWIRDRDTAKATGHLAATFYQKENGGPCLRFGSLSESSVSILAREFDDLWNRSRDAPSGQ